jgi:hypothetical protein
MATFLDIGLFQHFKIIFPLLFVLVLIYALLEYTHFLGNNKAIHAFIALMFALMVSFSGIAIDSINNMAPWFVILFLFVIFSMLTFMSFGYKTEDIMSTLVRKDFRWVLNIVGAVVLMIVLGSVLSEVSKRGGVGTYGSSNETAEVTSGTSQQSDAFYKTLFHPKVLGMVFVLLVMTFAVSKITAKPFD